MGLKTFTQVYISASATAIETRKVTQLNKEAPVCAFRACVFFYIFIYVGHRLKRKRWGGNTEILSGDHLYMK